MITLQPVTSALSPIESQNLLITVKTDLIFFFIITFFSPKVKAKYPFFFSSTTHQFSTGILCVCAVLHMLWLNLAGG